MRIVEWLKKSPIINKDGYNYIIHPITDGIPYIEAEMLEEIADEISKIMPDVDRIVTIEAMGIPIATALSLKTGIPFTIIRKRKYGLPGEIEVRQKTGYSEAKLYINGVEKGEKIAIVDDVLSTGGTLKAVVKALKDVVEIKGIYIVICKGDKKKIEEETGFNIHTMLDIKVEKDEVKIL